MKTEIIRVPKVKYNRKTVTVTWKGQKETFSYFSFDVFASELAVQALLGPKLPPGYLRRILWLLSLAEGKRHRHTWPSDPQGNAKRRERLRYDQLRAAIKSYRRTGVPGHLGLSHEVDPSLNGSQKRRLRQAIKRLNPRKMLPI